MCFPRLRFGLVMSPSRTRFSSGRTELSGPSRLRLLYLSRFSQPAIDRPIYRAIRQRPVEKIVELGIGDCQRTLRMLEIAGIHCPPAEICYAGIDLFETRRPGDGPPLTLKRAFQLLRATGARIRLIPGDPFTALSGAANLLAATDLLVVSAVRTPIRWPRHGTSSRGCSTPSRGCSWSRPARRAAAGCGKRALARSINSSRQPVAAGPRRVRP